MNEKKCRFPNGMSIMPDSKYEFDPCVYESVETIRFSKAPIEVSLDRCVNCGYYEVSWRMIKND